MSTPQDTPETSAPSETLQRDGLPLVSVVIPVRNEEGFIARTLDQILAQDYPAESMEIIVADGMSDDRTRDILAEYAERYPQVRMVDNPERITPVGLNVAIAAARGEIITRIDGHCEVAGDFIRCNIELLDEHPEAWVTGGPIVHAGKNAFGEAVAVAMSHPAGVGMATHRFPDYEGYVEGAQFPTFRRWVFDRIGMFDERLVRNQDDELNYRITQAGGKCFVSPRVRYVYYVRGRIGQLFRQYFQYSFWRIPVMKKHKRPTTPRQVMPLLFYFAVVVMAILGIVLRNPWVALALPAVYLATLGAIGLSQIPRKGLRVALLVPVAIAVMHLAYALGMLYGFWASAFRRRAWDPRGSMSALTR
ncbi:MAG: glycosyltransferase family 2 protein [Planctomycetota bacterium]|nr:MAG: glycosyltransferase family 2 protein [Planctomycetota bacterium]